MLNYYCWVIDFKHKFWLQCHVKDLWFTLNCSLEMLLSVVFIHSSVEELELPIAALVTNPEIFLIFVSVWVGNASDNWQFNKTSSNLASRWLVSYFPRNFGNQVLFWYLFSNAHLSNGIFIDVFIFMQMSNSIIRIIFYQPSI